MKVNWESAGSGQKEDTTNHYHIFCGDLSPEVDDQALHNAFSAFGSISEARIMRDPATNRSKGYGFVAFRIKEDAEKALREMNGEWLGGRAIRCNWANQKTRGAAGPISSDINEVSLQTTPNNTTVYIGNLAPDISESMLQSTFQEFGTIEEIRIQREKGFAFVRYNTHDSAARSIIGLNGRVLGSKAIKVSWGKEATQQAATGANAAAMPPLLGFPPPNLNPVLGYGAPPPGFPGPFGVPPPGFRPF